MRRPYKSHPARQHPEGRALPGEYRTHKKRYRKTECSINTNDDDSNNQKSGLVADFVGSIIENGVRDSENRELDRIEWLDQERQKYSWKTNEFDDLVLKELNKQRTIYSKSTQGDNSRNIRLSIIETLIPLYGTFTNNLQ